MKTLLCLSSVLVAVAMLGCGSSGPFDYVPVSGKVTYQDGSPVPNVKLVFLAQDAPPVAGAVPRPAEANVDAQGEFRFVTSYKYGDGLIPGKHKVVVQVPRGESASSIIAKEYTNSETTPLVIDTADSPLHITVPKSST